jgi:hypothetical protein
MRLSTLRSKTVVIATTAAAVGVAGICSALAVGAAGSDAAGRPAGVSAPIARGIGINGVFVNHVKLDGQVLSINEYAARQKQLARSGKDVYEYYDGWMTKQGYTLATTNKAVFASWKNFADHEPMTRPSVAANAVSSASAARTGATAVTCSFSKGAQYTVAWTNSGCSGSSEVLPPGQTRTSVVYNDSWGALEIGCKVSDVQVWKNGNNTGPNRLFGNSSYDTDYTPLSAYAYSDGSNVNDSVSSYKTIISGAC